MLKTLGEKKIYEFNTNQNTECFKQNNPNSQPQHNLQSVQKVLSTAFWISLWPRPVSHDVPGSFAYQSNNIRFYKKASFTFGREKLPDGALATELTIRFSPQETGEPLSSGKLNDMTIKPHDSVLSTTLWNYQVVLMIRKKRKMPKFYILFWTHRDSQLRYKFQSVVLSVSQSTSGSVAPSLQCRRTLL